MKRKYKPGGNKMKKRKVTIIVKAYFPFVMVQCCMESKLSCQFLSRNKY